MNNKEIYVTITGVQYFMGLKPFDIGSKLQLIKEPENKYDAEAIAVYFPFFGQVGHVANSINTIARGTISAGRLYEQFGKECSAEVLFITQTKVIARVYPDKKLKQQISVTLDDFDVDSNTNTNQI